MKKNIASVLTVLACGLPILASAAVGAVAPGPTFANLVYSVIIPFIDAVIVPFLYGIAFISFLWGIFLFFFTGGEENRTRGKQFAVWGIIGFVVLFGVWTIVGLLLTTLLPAA